MLEAEEEGVVEEEEVVGVIEEVVEVIEEEDLDIVVVDGGQDLTQGLMVEHHTGEAMAVLREEERPVQVVLALVLSSITINK